MTSEYLQVVTTLKRAIGEQYVITDLADRQYFSRDLSWEPAGVAAIVAQPGSVDELVTVVATANEVGIAVVPRGGGMSYTRGYVPAHAATILLDLRRLNRIVEVNTEDMYVTAECGCTWEQLYATLRAQGVRTPYWGPLSGRYATVGGALSQNSLFYGSARYGSVADSVLGLEVVLAGGRRLRTGSGGSLGGSPFFRYFGPDLTGLFVSDTGAFGIKATATLKLIPFPAVTKYASFAFDDFGALAGAQKAMSPLLLAAEIYGFDPYYHNVFARAGFSFLAREQWSLHIVVDAHDEASAESALAALRAIAARQGREIDGSLPPAVRADPFGAVRSVLLGPEGESWLPIHAFVPASKSQSVICATQRFFAENSEMMRHHGISVSYLTATSGTDFVFEPSFYWKDELGRFRLERIESEFAERWKTIPANLPARQAVLQLRRQLAALFDRMGGIHIQIGKYYAYETNMEPRRWQVLRDIKKVFDPQNLVNPGVLGFTERV
jgi:D-lactate dehydrogenase (cytochrome)